MTIHPSLDLAVIGNGNLSALVDRSGAIVWMCWPRVDGDPLFCALIDGEKPEDGFFSIVFDDEKGETEQSYVRNSAIVRTIVRSESGAAFSITDFAPRFHRHDRLFNPPTIVRVLEPLSGLCRIRIRLRPRMAYGSLRPTPVMGSNHVRFAADGGGSIRLSTDAPVSYVATEGAFVLSRRMTLILHPDEPMSDSIPRVGREFQDRTLDSWHTWVRHLNLPFEWQEQVIRAAITLQLCSFEQTGAIVAALTTSMPEAPREQRNWDYRYCWIRDAYFTVLALNRVGASVTMERFIDYVTNIISMEGGSNMRPVYAILPESDLEERVAPDLAGYRGYGPVRIGNDAVNQVQHDVYGSVILAASQMFFDERLPKKGDEHLFAMLEPLGMRALAVALTTDAGIWEYRDKPSIHTYSAAMCWVACDRLARIATRLGLQERAEQWRKSADGLRNEILVRAWNAKLKVFTGSLDSDHIDASVLLLAELGLVKADDPKFVSTVEVIGDVLARNGYLFRYAAPDDFGAPSTAFTICSFWYVEALAAIGRPEEARVLFEKILARRNHVGLLSEDIDPVTGELWGNFPQTYSLVGIILCAMRLSKSWEVAR
ncbi:glycoside hydrolase family 15 protein [Rhodoblastus acidophilus]|uniref:Glycoside hydrolase family 15 protein n=1 Tax=Candidatus Rhodoblastus alkanivorans TaxID=2954117 RepID=A0ABS9Z829_9HYPH|nr:glycoside hydrolase family 15 protein [Candidatus Rhodoblastus alkanivorans]MCI4678979.1 glycoside hydrolase family 15 protein [Candidatus Rhodoblastus alkanivorans]MCI4683757.1 glycoside hydrolase family 15 protein [Candidatus Rhodoblastus alkanivorans]MDI4641075.1 glycoside hydrolase family 15 protein [Rhodoblastus acidophilus]